LLEIAAANHPDLAAAVARAEAARGQLVQAGLRLNPFVVLGDEEINNPSGRAGRSYFGVQQDIITNRKRQLAQAAAARGLDAADWQALTQWYIVATRVLSAYYEVLTAHREVQVNGEVVRFTRQGLEAAERLRRAGAGTQPDVLRARVALDQ